MTQATTVSTQADSGPSSCLDIADRHGIIELLRDFYCRAFRDELLGPVFIDIARMDLVTHLPMIADSWETVLRRTGSYRRNALAPHQRLHARARLTPARSRFPR